MTPRLRNFILLALMLAAAGLAVALRPTHKISDQGPKVDLEKMIPRSFADWREEPYSAVQIVDPQQKELIKTLYSQTLSRTFVNQDGYRVMLSIAYGTDQSDAMQMHLPDLCYPAQGFELLNKKNGTLDIGSGSIPVTRMLTRLGPRSEPVTYWATIGDRVVQGGINKKLIEMSYGLKGKIPDGMLIRVSSIDAEAEKAYEIQNRFSAQMIDALAPEHRRRMTGALQLN